MATSLEKSLVQRRKTQGVLRPLLEDLFRSPVEIESKEDANFIHSLAMTQVEREEMRRIGDGVFSPSGLASCLRRVYLGRHHKRLGLEKVELPSVTAHGYFTGGNFIHLKWQFALYKLAVRSPRVHLVGNEIPVISKRRDHGGTLDSLILVDDVPYVVDFKGLNVHTFNDIVRGEVPIEYQIQLGDYMMLANALKTKFRANLPRIEHGILLVESKGGPDYTHPLGIHEVHIRLDDVLPEVRKRLEVLRKHERAEKIPAPECRSTKITDFQGCPFAEFCRREVKRFENQDRAKTETVPLRLSTPRRR